MHAAIWFLGLIFHDYVLSWGLGFRVLRDPSLNAKEAPEGDEPPPAKARSRAQREAVAAGLPLGPAPKAGPPKAAPWLGPVGSSLNPKPKPKTLNPKP